MFDLYIKVGSITNAQRAQRILREKGYKASIKRVENPTEADGCGYLVAVRCDSEAPVRILSDSGIEVRGVEKK